MTSETSAKFRDLALGTTGIAIIIGFFYATIGYLGPIKSNTEFLPSIENRLISMQEAVGLIPSIREDITYLRAKTIAEITILNGGQLTSLDWHTTVTVPPESITQTALLAYEPVATANLPVKSLPGSEFLGYNFSLIPYTTTGSQLVLPDLKKPADLYIAHATLELDPEIVKPEDLILFRWDQKEAKWLVTPTTIEGNNLYAQIPQFSLFSLGVKI